MKKLLIFGLKRNFKIIVNEIFKFQNYKIIGFVDENIKVKSVKIDNKKISNLTKNIKSIINNKNVSGLVTFGDNYLRKKIYEKVHKINKNFKWEILISKNAIVDKSVKIGQGSIIMPGVIINCYSKIGKMSLINTGSIIEHDNILKDFSSTAPGVTTSGNLTLGELSHLGTASTVIHDIKIGQNTILGANSLAIKNLDKNSVYVGNPAKKIKKRKVGLKYL